MELLGLVVAGLCPMGCGPTLILGEGGMVGCSSPGCPRPSAVTEILSDPETEHVLEVGADGWSARHPLRERLDDQLLSCDLTAAMLEGLPTPPGRYRVRRIPRLLPEWAWERLA
jgi:Family of unknown function (DUF6085)